MSVNLDQVHFCTLFFQSVVVDDRVPSHQDQSKEKARNDRDAYYHDRYGQKGKNEFLSTLCYHGYLV